MKFGRLRATAIGGAATVLSLLLLVNPGRAVTVDFSSIADCPASCPVSIDATTFASQGIVFTVSNGGVGLIQGDEALGSFGPGEKIAASFITPQSLTNLSVQLAPTSQGTRLYTLTGYNAALIPVGSVSRQVTQDFGDPENTGFGYFSLVLDPITEPVSSFEVSSVFIRSSFGPCCQGAGYGVASVTWDTAVTPLPAALPLFVTGLGALGLFGWRRTRA